VTPFDSSAPTLPNTATAADALNVMADLLALYFNTKNFLWHMTGPHFRDHHLLLDEQATHGGGTQ
jgi:starvation-inducible DNA-binding protein